MGNIQEKFHEIELFHFTPFFGPLDFFLIFWPATLCEIWKIFYKFQFYTEYLIIRYFFLYFVGHCVSNNSILPKSIVQIHQRSLRSTPDRIRKRCQVGRAASDTSSGISDDGSSSTHSGSDSGIETASLDGGQPTILEQGVQNMSLDMEKFRETTTAQHEVLETGNGINQPRLKLTLRMKRSTSNGSETGNGNIVEDLPNYEVFRMEGVGSTNGDRKIEKFRETTTHHELETTGNGNNTPAAWRIRKRTRKRDISSCSSTSSGGSSSGGQNGLKRLKLRLGDETMSTIDLDSSNCMT